jgi:hypothetical protein
MSSWRARAGAATLSVLIHALLIWAVAEWNVAQPGSQEAPNERVVVSLAPPRPAPPRAAPPPPAPPPPAAEAPPPPEPEPEPESEPPAETAPEEAPPEVEIPLPQQQIVSMPDAGEERPPDDTRFLSDRDNVVDQQTVRQGEPAPSEDLDGDDIADADPDSSAPENENDSATRAAEERAAAAARAAAEMADARARDRGRADRPVPDIASLMPNALALAAEQARNAPAAETPEDGGSPPRKARERSAVAWEPSTTLRGTLDHLPDIQPGNVTLLNTKAELFAPFVRRVMLRVFQNMMILLRRSAPSMRPGANEQIEAEAIMSPAGDMISLRITQRSTSMSIGLDRMLHEACNEAFFDRNPPPGAVAEDGNIHFVMQTVVQTFPTAGQRGVGLSGLFGVGLK